MEVGRRQPVSLSQAGTLALSPRLRSGPAEQRLSGLCHPTGQWDPTSSANPSRQSGDQAPVGFLRCWHSRCFCQSSRFMFVGKQQAEFRIHSPVRSVFGNDAPPCVFVCRRMGRDPQYAEAIGALIGIHPFSLDS